MSESIEEAGEKKEADDAAEEKSHRLRVMCSGSLSRWKEERRSARLQCRLAVQGGSAEM